MIRLLHIYGQEHPHSDAYLVGTRAGLFELQKAIGQALDHGKGETIHKDGSIYVNDGEGYRVKVIMVDYLEPHCLKLALPYSSDLASEIRDNAVWPWKIWNDLEEKDK